MEKVKMIIIAVWGALMSALGVLAVPVLLLVFCNVIDYFTGVMAAKYRSQSINSYKGIKGITKKVAFGCCWCGSRYVIAVCRGYGRDCGSVYIFSSVYCCNLAGVQRTDFYFRKYLRYWCNVAAVFTADCKEFKVAGRR